MNDEKLKFSKLTDSEIILAAAQLTAAYCASVPREHDCGAAQEQVRNAFEGYCQALLEQREKDATGRSAGMDLS